MLFLCLKVHESFPLSIALSWKGSTPDSQNGESESQQSSVVFPKGNPIPSVKALTFYRSNTFTVDIICTDGGDLQVPSKITTYAVTISYLYIPLKYSFFSFSLCLFTIMNLVGQIGPFQSGKGGIVKLKVKVRMNLHGIVSVESATVSHEKEVAVLADSQS